MDAILDDQSFEDAVVAPRTRRSIGCWRGISPERCSASSTQARAAAARPAPEVAVGLLGAVRPGRTARGACVSSGPRSIRRCQVRKPSPEPESAMIINQWVPAAHRGDAIGDSARRVRDLLRGTGHESDLFALTMDDDLRGDVRPFADLGGARRRRHDLPLRAALADDRGVRARWRGGSCSITTSRRRHSSRRTTRLFRLAALGRQRAGTLAGRVDLALGDSEYNRRELEALGFAPDRRHADCGRHRAHHGGAGRPALEKILATA